MSNGTRIDPEEREPRAIKLRKPKHTGRKIAFSVIASVIVLALGFGSFAFIKYGPDLGFSLVTSGQSETEKEPEASSESSSEESTEESSPSEASEPEEPEIPEESEPIPEPEPEKPSIPKDEWYMLLVNKENPLPADYTFETSAIDLSGHSVDSRILADLSAMITAGEEEGLQLVFYTAYRSVQRQNELFAEGKTDVPGGSSEHNCGLAVDIGCAKGDFEGSSEQAWLFEHAHEYGFILRYPEGKEEVTGFAHEPWHYRYVGKEQAALIKESGLCLEEYLAQE